LPRGGPPRTIIPVSGVRVPSLLTLLCLGGLACSNEIDAYGADADTGSTHALVSVERSGSVDGSQSRGGALAGFVRMPAHVDARALMSLVGLDPNLPELGRCIASSDQKKSQPLSGLGTIELLDAGDVALEADGLRTTLAPRAFPTVTDSISGVMYTTRDRSADALPAHARYSMQVAGSEEIAALALEATAPSIVDGATIGGIPLAEVESISIKQPLDLTWSVGSAGDLLYVQLVAQDGSVTSVCSFKDDLGAATVPANTFAGMGPGYLAVHRVRLQEFRGGGIDRGQLRFDFELTANVSFVE
jgi:hypothetical protein